MKKADSRIVFALTSEGKDYFSAMTRIAVESIRITNPTVLATLACDSDTATNLEKNKDPLLKEVDDILVIETPAGVPGFRNRWVKTSLRRYVTGPFLFLDSDILVRGDLSPVFAVPADLAAAANHSLERLEDQIWSEDRDFLNKMSWLTSDQVYVNGGVIFYNDTPGAHEFARVWHEKWRDAYALNTRFRDQPALNAALFETKAHIQILEDRFNCQFIKNKNNLSNAVIWHYYSSGANIPVSAFDLLAKNLVNGERLSRKNVAQLIARPHPWRSENLVDDRAAARIILRNRFDGWEAAWLERDADYFVEKFIHNPVRGAAQRFIAGLGKMRNMLVGSRKNL